jgi:hypothetical protein
MEMSTIVKVLNDLRVQCEKCGETITVSRGEFNFEEVEYHDKQIGNR